MSDPTAGISCPDMRRVVRETLTHPEWEWAGLSGTTHGRLRHIPTGTVLTFGLTPKVASWKSLATDVRRASGVDVWRKGNRRASRKAIRVVPVDTRMTPTEAAACDEAAALTRDVTAMNAELDALAGDGSRDAARRARRIITARTAAARRLTELHHPIPGGATWQP